MLSSSIFDMLYDRPVAHDRSSATGRPHALLCMLFESHAMKAVSSGEAVGKLPLPLPLLAVAVSKARLNFGSSVPKGRDDLVIFGTRSLSVLSECTSPSDHDDSSSLHFSGSCCIF